MKWAIWPWNWTMFQRKVGFFDGTQLRDLQPMPDRNVKASAPVTPQPPATKDAGTSMSGGQVMAPKPDDASANVRAEAKTPTAEGAPAKPAEAITVGEIKSDPATQKVAEKAADPTVEKPEPPRPVRSHGARVFQPHAFQTKVSLEGDAVIHVSKEARDKMYHLEDMAPDEVGWLGTAYFEGGEFWIEDIFLFKQKVSAVTTRITSEGLSEFGNDLLKQPNGVKIWNAIRFWGHSHDEMGTTASGQDEDQMKLFAETDHEWFIRGIINAKGRMQFSIFFYFEKQVLFRIDDVPWVVDDEIDQRHRFQLEEEFRKKVR